MVASCTSALPQGRCVLGVEAPADTETQAIALVSWDRDEPLKVTIRVGRRRDDLPAWVTDSLKFRPADAPLERWATVGFTIGTLVGEVSPRTPAPASSTGSAPPAQGSPEPNPPNAAAAAASATVTKKPAPSAPDPAEVTLGVAQPEPDARRRFTRIQWGALLGTGLSKSSPRTGGFVSVAHHFARLPAYPTLGLEVVQGRGSADSSDLAARWLAAAGGAGLTLLTHGTSRLDLELLFGVQNLEVTALDQRHERTNAFGRLRLAGEYGLSKHWGVAGAASLRGLPGSLSIAVTDQGQERELSREPALGVDGSLGIEARW
jgi:hypothetical protein